MILCDIFIEDRERTPTWKETQQICDYVQDKVRYPQYRISRAGLSRNSLRTSSTLEVVKGRSRDGVLFVHFLWLHFNNITTNKFKVVLACWFIDLSRLRSSRTKQRSYTTTSVAQQLISISPVYLFLCIQQYYCFFVDSTLSAHGDYRVHRGDHPPVLAMSTHLWWLR